MSTINLAWQAVEKEESQNERGREKRAILLRPIFSRFTRSSQFLFPSPSDASHAG